MLANYLIYFYSLASEKKSQQILIILLLFLILFTICGILKFLKLKFLHINKSSFFQRFLKKL